MSVGFSGLDSFVYLRFPFPLKTDLVEDGRGIRQMSQKVRVRMSRMRQRKKRMIRMKVRRMKVRIKVRLEEEEAMEEETSRVIQCQDIL